MLITGYLRKNILTATVFIALTLTAVIWLTQSLRLLEMLVDSDAPFWDFIKMLMLTMPSFLVIVLPIALVAAVLFTYNRLIMDNELIVMRAGGMSARNLYRPLMHVSAIAALVMLLSTTYLSPMATAMMQDIRMVFKSQYSTLLIREGVFNTLGKDVTVYVRKRRGGGTLEGLMIYDKRDANNPPVVIVAERGRFVMDEAAPRVVVQQGVREQLDPRTGTMTKLFFDEYTVGIEQEEASATSRWRKPDERMFHELFQTDQGVRHYRNRPEFFRAEVHNRLVAPIFAITMPLVAFACLMIGAHSRRGYGHKIWIAVSAVLMLQLMLMLMGSHIQKNNGAIPLFYTLAILPGVIAFLSLDERGDRAASAIMRFLRRRRIKGAA